MGWKWIGDVVGRKAGPATMTSRAVCVRSLGSRLPLWFKHGCARLKLAATHVVVCGLVWPPSLSHVVV